MANWDVIVIGLGGVGSAAAYHLASAGHRVLGLEQYEALHDRGSSHGKTRIIRQAYFEHPSYVPLLQEAYRGWEELEQRSGSKLFHRTGLVEAGPGDGIVIPGILQSARQYDLPVEQLSMSEVQQRWPGISGDPDWQAVIELNAGFLRVEACVRAHQQLASELGATCMYEVAAREWKVDGAGVAVTTDRGIERAARLVVAGGPWSGRLLAELNLPLKILRKHQYWYQPETDGFELVDDFPCFFHETESGFFYGFPSIDGSGVKVARHSGGQPVEQPTESHPDDREDQTLVEAYMQRCLPGLGRQLLSRAGCYYTTTPDEHFVVDVHPEHPQVTIVAGLSGHGFKFTSVLGELASQLATSQRPVCDIRFFALDRLGGE